MLVKLMTTPEGLASFAIIAFMVGIGVFFIKKALKSSWDGDK